MPSIELDIFRETFVRWDPHPTVGVGPDLTFDHLSDLPWEMPNGMIDWMHENDPDPPMRYGYRLEQFGSRWFVGFVSDDSASPNADRIGVLCYHEKPSPNELRTFKSHQLDDFSAPLDWGATWNRPSIHFSSDGRYRADFVAWWPRAWYQNGTLKRGISDPPYSRINVQLPYWSSDDVSTVYRHVGYRRYQELILFLRAGSEIVVESEGMTAQLEQVSHALDPLDLPEHVRQQLLLECL